ncbi:nuclear transport factor 2 family protein [Nocardia rhamnosiphila]|uniref:nuclear transport factor 2 family protein n=1 Tax=Nocardia rhamnosiphila TaxID=426716 RepID=UPI003400C5DA
MTDPAPARLQWLLDQQEIRDVVARYTRAIDRRDWDLLRTCYHPGAIDRHTGFEGDIETFIAFLDEVLPRYPSTQHLVGQQYVEIDGDVARCESYGMATHHSGPGGDPATDYTSGFRYIDRMERRDGEWRIADRIAVRDWTRSDSGSARYHVGPGPKARPSREDPLYHLPGWPPIRKGQ